MGLKSIALTTRPRMLACSSNSPFQEYERPVSTPKKKKKSDTFSICACHPCAGAMLIFSVSFQFYRMRRVLPRSKSRRRSAYFVLSNKKKKKNKKKVSQREARTLNLPVNSRARCQLRHPGTDNDFGCQINSNVNRSRHRRQKKQKESPYRDSNPESPAP